MAPLHALDTEAEAVWLGDYGARSLYRISPARFDALSKRRRADLELLEDADRVTLGGVTLDAREGRTFADLVARAAPAEGSGPGLWLVQLVGPIREAWLEDLRRLGAEPITAVAHHGYLVWAGSAAREALEGLAEERRTVQLATRYEPWLKLAPSLRASLAAKESESPAETVKVLVQVFDHAGVEETRAFVEQNAERVVGRWSKVARFSNLDLEVRRDRLWSIASRPDVTWIGERRAIEFLDEKQAQVLVDLESGVPSGPGYLDFLAARGFSQVPADYPIVVLNDSGFDQGGTDADATMHVAGNAALPTRMAFVNACGPFYAGSDDNGHGHLDVSIAGGYDDRAGFPFRDPEGFRRGLGLNPFGRFGSTRLDAWAEELGCGSQVELIQKNWQDGGRISSNSWQYDRMAVYDAWAQVWDAGVRDADGDAAGHQELVAVFAAGNAGAVATAVGTPGQAKNVITVGATENPRPTDEAGDFIDACGHGPAAADDARDMAIYSSRGPVSGGRTKPELVAPGTHVQGTATDDPFFLEFGGGVCSHFRPPGQMTFTASSGTSHAAPAVAGVSSLVWWWLKQGKGGDLVDLFADEVLPPAAPSPALLKAFLIAHTTYLTGVGAGDDLPSQAQGYGMPQMTSLFGDTDKVMIDQSLLFDDSGEIVELQVDVADPAQPVRVALVYTDAPGMIGSEPLVNDLDLTVRIGNSTFHGNVMNGPQSVTGGAPDRANNSEAVFLPVGTQGRVRVQVAGFEIAGDGVPATGDATDQDFALVCSNCSFLMTEIFSDGFESGGVSAWSAAL